MTKEFPIGHEVSCIMHGVDKGIIENNRLLEKILMDSLKEDGFTILKIDSQAFTPRGYTAFVLLAESHAVIHTYPEYQSLTYHIYSCRGKNDGKKAFEYFKEKMNPASCDTHERDMVVDPHFQKL